MSKHVFGAISRTEEQKKRDRELHERFRREQPSLEELVASGEYTEPISQADFWELREAMLALRKCREAAGVSLASLSERTGIDRAALSRLETGAQDNPTINTLQRYAFALGKQIVVQVIDLPAAQVPGDG
ncbi:MAG: hypothetical protein B7Z73_00220 [Planctomycetia bacterium 21-64-5]|nr:MAG: hypothetical protein B7Z73_00220 [Planctomycetia bacterium 21-64-5]